jgi:uncharacterized protein (TIGR00251 family)
LVRISIQVHPGAKKNAILRFQDGVWHMKIAVPPVEGKANKELIEFLSEILGVSNSRITIEKGTTSRKKLIAVEGLTEAEVTKRLQTS